MSHKKERKERYNELKRTDMLVAAEKLFFQQGYDETTMKEIAEASGFAKGTLYNYFNSKEDLYVAIAAKAYTLNIEITKEFINKVPPGMDQIKAIGYAYYEFTKRYPNYANIFHDVDIKIPDLNDKPETQRSNYEKEYLEWSNQYRDIFVNVLESAISKGALRKDKNPFLIGFVLSRITNGIINDIMQSEDFIKRFKLKKDEIVDFVFEILEDGLKPRESKYK